MATESLKARYKELKQTLRQHSYQYYVLNQPSVSDHEYDHLLNELRQIEEQHPSWITPDSPTQRVGIEPSERFNKVTHPAPILSLANAFNSEGIYAWLERISKEDERVLNIDFVVEPKLDGLSVILHYEDGILIQGATRGNGEVGEDITTNLRTMKSIPLRIPVNPSSPPPPSSLFVRGEVFINISDFAKLNQRQAELGEKTYQTPRNTAAGALRQLDPTITASRPLRLLVYSIVSANGEVPNNQLDLVNYLKELGFPTPDNIEYCPDIETVVQVCESWVEKRDSLPYEIDGAVVKINDLTLSADLGIAGKDPRGAIAFKFPAQEVATTLEGIGVNIGRTGILTPYAILEAIEIGGVNVQRATLHNFDFIEEKDIRIGDRVLIKRAGDVIPYVIGPVKSARAGREKVYQPPTTCPECGEPVSHFEGEVGLYCINPVCPEQLIRNVEHFVSRTTLDIVGLGIKIVEQFVNEGLIKDVADLYALKKEDILNLEGFAEKKADNLIASIENSKQQPLSRLLFALGIRGVGEVVAADLANAYGSLDNLSKSQADDLTHIEGIGPNIAKAIIDWFNRPANQKVLAKLKQAKMWPEEQVITNSDLPRPFEGLTFVVTGTLQNFSRTEIKEYIKARGGKVTSSVSKKTSYVIVGENPGSKLTKAQEFKIQTLNEDALIILANKNA